MQPKSGKSIIKDVLDGFSMYVQFVRRSLDFIFYYDFLVIYK
jgi:hypothetical protein